MLPYNSHYNNHWYENQNVNFVIKLNSTIIPVVHCSVWMYACLFSFSYSYNINWYHCECWCMYWVCSQCKRPDSRTEQKVQLRARWCRCCWWSRLCCHCCRCHKDLNDRLTDQSGSCQPMMLFNVLSPACFQPEMMPLCFLGTEM